MTPGRLVIAAAVVSAALAVVLALRVPAGLPYDEPSHFDTVARYATERAMPVMGDPGVTYEAQMGPGYYASSGVLYAVGDAVSGSELGFRLVRLAGAAVCLAVAALSYRLLLVVVPHDPWAAAWGTTLLVLNPAVLFVVSSVQNDGLLLVLSIAFALVAFRTVARGSATWRDGLFLGVLAAAAVLTKVSAFVVIVPGLAAVGLATWRRGAGRAVGLAVGLIVASTGWWFVRNQVLYGTLDGRNGVERTGAFFPSEPLSLGSLWRFVRFNLYAYLWTPVEYLRNAIRTPRWWTALTAVMSAAAAFGWFLGRPRRAEPARTASRPPWLPDTPARAAAATTVFALLTFAVFYFGLGTTALAGRFVYPVLPFITLALTIGLLRLARWVEAADRRPGMVGLTHALPGALAVLGVVATVQMALALPSPPTPFITFG